MEAISVSEFIYDIKNLLEGEFTSSQVLGEISNLSLSSAGHWYFTLSDEKASISCALFKGDALRNPMIRQLKDGDQIVLFGPLSLYAKRGSIQLIAKQLTKYGVGNLKDQFEKLKKKLAAEGLFDLSRKKSIPLLPEKIAVITAPGSAALQDFLNVMKRRTLWHNILIIPAVVQGDSSPKSLISALNLVKKRNDIDICVLTRGGGSLEDLWSFNDEKLVRTIAEFPIPVISAVGHQVDFTLCDFVSDLRCETPTAAAEIISQEQTYIKERLIFLRQKLLLKIKQVQSQIDNTFQKFHPKMLIQKLWQLFQNYQKVLGQYNLANRFYELSHFYEHQQSLDELSNRLVQSIDAYYKNYFHKLNSAHMVLKAIDPTSVLKRGYSYVVDEKGSVLLSSKDFKKLAIKSKLKIQFHDGFGNVEKN